MKVHIEKKNPNIARTSNDSSTASNRNKRNAYKTNMSCEPNKHQCYKLQNSFIRIIMQNLCKIYFLIDRFDYCCNYTSAE